MIELSGVTMRLPAAGGTVTILEGIDLNIPKGDFVAIVGPSGSGKSTLLGLMAGLDRPTSGSICIDGVDLSQLTEDALARLRREKMGIVFQSFYLIPTFTALENVQIPLDLLGRAHAEEEAEYLINEVGLSARKHHYPSQLSGGEQQRVAIARAFSGRPAYLFADEPTGNLDTHHGARVLDLLARLHQEQGSTLVLVTHDPALSTRARRITSLCDGKVIGDETHRCLP